MQKEGEGGARLRRREREVSRNTSLTLKGGPASMASEVGWLGGKIPPHRRWEGDWGGGASLKEGEAGRGGILVLRRTHSRVKHTSPPTRGRFRRNR